MSRHTAPGTLPPAVLLGCLLLSACASSAGAPSAGAPALAPVEFLTFRYGGPSNELIADVMDDERDAPGDELMASEMKVEHVVAHAASAREAAAAAAAAVSTIQDRRVREIVRETAAQNLLHHWGGRAGAAEHDVLASATSTLVTRESPEAALVWTGLQAVGDQWTPERRQAAAARTLAAIDAAGLRRCLLCGSSGEPTVTTEEDAELAAFNKQSEELAARRDAAVRALEEIAG